MQNDPKNQGLFEIPVCFDSSMKEATVFGVLLENAEDVIFMAFPGAYDTTKVMRFPNFLEIPNYISFPLKK